MKLTLGQMKAITKGVMDVTEENGAFVFHRLSKAQMSIYAPNTGGWRRSQALASVALGSLEAVRGMVRMEAEKYPANRVADCQDFIPHVSPFYADGLHPNALGHTFYARGLVPELCKLIKV